MQAVQIKSVEANPGILGARVIESAQPAHEAEHRGIAPHPGGEPPEITEGRPAAAIRADAAHVPVDAIGVGPIGFNGDRGEAMLFNQPPRDFGAIAVELVGAVRRFAEKDGLRVTHRVEQGVVAVPVVDRLDMLADESGQI